MVPALNASPVRFYCVSEELGKMVDPNQSDDYFVYHIENEKVVWSVVEYRDDDTLSISIDAKTGELVDKKVEIYE